MFRRPSRHGWPGWPSATAPTLWHPPSQWLELLRSEGLLSGPDPYEAAIIAAMHRLPAATPSRLKLISPYDVLAEPRQPNLPGTIDEYPNSQLPLPEALEELRADPRVAEITAAFRD